MDTKNMKATKTGLLDRFRQSWFPPAAVVGAFSAFVAAAFRVRPEPKPATRPAAGPGAGGPLVQLKVAPSPARSYEREYVRTLFPTPAFRTGLLGIAIGPADEVLALGDGEVRVFDSRGVLLRALRAGEDATCLAAGPDGRVFLGAGARVLIVDATGKQSGNIAVGSTGRQANITAVKVYKGELLLADAAARLIRRYDLSGRPLGIIGDKSKAGSFILPNRSLDFEVDVKGVVRATDSGRHQVTAWTLDGNPLSSFGRFGMSNPEDFVGCCNPVNLALTPDGKVVTAEKMIARVKVFEPDGRLLALIGPENFDPGCTHIYLAVDSKGRIIAADPVRREIKVFTPAARKGEAVPHSVEHQG